MRRTTRRVTLGWVGAALLATVLRAGEGNETLVVVNGDPITSADIDAAIMAMHAETGMETRREFDFRRLLDKAINDRLIMQEALSLGLDEEPSVIGPVLDRRMTAAISAYSRANADMPETVEAAAVRQVFEDFYWQIQLRQLSVRNEDEAREARAVLEGGASWDSLAAAISLDTHRYRGGLHNLKYWADVENVLRDASRGLDPGAISDPFPYRESYSIIRVERRVPVDESSFASLEREIYSDLLRGRQEAAWEAFVDAHIAQTPITVHADALDRVRADSSLVLRGEFLEGEEGVALSLDPDHVVTERELRKAISHAAMQAGLDTFEKNLGRGMRVESRDLVLGFAAERDGYLDDPQVVSRYEADLEKSLIDAYLNEMIVPRIVLTREEIQAFYDEHQEDFRGPNQVQLATLILQTEEEAKAASTRLKDGADFEFIRDQYNPRSEAEGSTRSTPWTSETVFSDAIRDQLDRMEVGESSDPITLSNGWMVFKLKNRRSGEVQPLEVVEATIRQVIFQEKFKVVMDEQLALLKERSEIERNDQAIADYFSSGS